MKYILIAAALALGLLLAGCEDDGERLTGSGERETRSYELRGFNALEARNAFQVEVTAGAEFAVEVEADDNLFEVLIVEVRGDRLFLGVTAGTSIEGEYRARVVAPDLREIRASGAVRVDAFDFTSRIDREIRLSGASTLEATINANELRLEVSGASRALLSGEAERVELEVSGASEAAALDLVARVARIEVSGASTARLTVNEVIERAEASGASSLVYGGDPVVEDASTSGASSIRRR